MDDDDEIGYEDEFNDFENNKNNISLDSKNQNNDISLNQINNNSSNNPQNHNIDNNIQKNSQSNNFDINSQNKNSNNNNQNNNNYIPNSFNLFDNNEIINKESQPSTSIINNEEEKKLFIELDNLEKEKQEWYRKRKEQNEILQKNMELLSSLTLMNQIEFPNIKNNAKIELNNLILYNSKISEIESEERILEEDKKLFEQYKSNFNKLYEEKQKEIEILKLNYEKEKTELDKKIELLEIEEKMINDKYNNFEKEKNILTERYNNAIQKESSLKVSKMRIENSLRELDRRNLIIEKNNQMINENRKEIESEINKNNIELKRIYDEKNNLKLRQEMIDSIRMKYVGDVTNNPFDYNKKPNIENKYNNMSTIRQNTFYNAGQIKNNGYENDYLMNEDIINKRQEKDLFKNYNNEQQKLSIVNEEENNIKNSSNNSY